VSEEKKKEDKSPNQPVACQVPWPLDCARALHNCLCQRRALVTLFHVTAGDPWPESMRLYHVCHCFQVCKSVFLVSIFFTNRVLVCSKYWAHARTKYVSGGRGSKYFDRVVSNPVHHLGRMGSPSGAYMVELQTIFMWVLIIPASTSGVLLKHHH
jgi:hypothetical protein